MNSQHLCPVYRKWLQLNPTDARKHRLMLQDRVQQAHLLGQHEKACVLGYQSLETAKVVITSLQNVTSHRDSAVQDDIIAYATMAMYLSAILHHQHRQKDAQQVLQDCQQQLIAILPLHATNTHILGVLKTVLSTLEQGSVIPHLTREVSRYIH